MNEMGNIKILAYPKAALGKSSKLSMPSLKK